ncbi:hypothetical protein HWV00_13465 [Moritella sp. 24]|uniref:hypothetical protein n=1 Tax=Moritella sp. 24 TaxID=2746230 RepID=UPI001BA847B1|nr:hypothetical protein [Moritella sp. 24]QUM77160.1 hypothetical protein HWV00_13465 [Moritella sp. 24]
MIKPLKKLTLALCVASISQFAMAEVETAEKHIVKPHGNVKTWEWGTQYGYHGYSYIRESFLAQDDKEITIPRIFSQDPLFTGDYTEKNVSNASIALKVFVEPGYRDPLSVTLNIVGEYNKVKYNVYKVGATMPLEGGDWKEYAFQIQSQSQKLPDGWHVFDMDNIDNNDRNIDVNTLNEIYQAVMTDVREISYTIGKRNAFYSVMNQWDVGAKNMRLIQKRQ